MYMNPWMKCACGKIHLRTGVRHESVCTCGLRLHERAYGLPIPTAVVARKRHG